MSIELLSWLPRVKILGGKRIKMIITSQTMPPVLQRNPEKHAIPALKRPAHRPQTPECAALAWPKLIKRSRAAWLPPRPRRAPIDPSWNPKVIARKLPLMTTWPLMVRVATNSQLVDWRQALKASHWSSKMSRPARKSTRLMIRTSRFCKIWWWIHPWTSSTSIIIWIWRSASSSLAPAAPAFSPTSLPKWQSEKYIHVYCTLIIY